MKVTEYEQINRALHVTIVDDTEKKTSLLSIGVKNGLFLFLNLAQLSSAKGLILPKKMRGLSVRGLDGGKELIFPEEIMEDFQISDTKYIENIVMPKKIGKWVTLYHIESIKNVVMPEKIGRDLHIYDARILQGVIMPKTVDGQIWIKKAEVIDDILMPEQMGELKTEKLKEIKRIKFREKLMLYALNEDVDFSYSAFSSRPLRFHYEQLSLNLNALKSPEGVVLPKELYGKLFLDGLTSGKGLELPCQGDGFISLNGLVSAEGLIFPPMIMSYECVFGFKDTKTINLKTNLTDLTSPKSQDIIGQTILSSKAKGISISLNGLKTGKGLKLPVIMQGNLYLNGLINSEGLRLPKIMKGSLYLNSLISSEGLVLPETIDGDLHIENLIYIDKNIFSKTKITGKIYTHFGVCTQKNIVNHLPNLVTCYKVLKAKLESLESPKKKHKR